MAITIAGGPVGEPTLGPVAFMHRASAAENPGAPLSHHIFDSTHISSDVALVRLDRGIMSVEGSLFHGRESDEHRFDLDFGSLHSGAWLSYGLGLDARGRFKRHNGTCTSQRNWNRETNGGRTAPCRGFGSAAWITRHSLWQSAALIEHIAV